MTAVELVAPDGSRHDLTEGPPVIVPAGDVVVLVRDAPSDIDLRLDGRVRGATVAGAAVLSLDLTRSTGFHHLHVPPGHDYWFGTEDARLGLDGVERMLDYLREVSRTWTGQLLFADGSYLRDPHVVYGWLDQYADAVLGAARAVGERPSKGTTTVGEVTSLGGRRLDLQRTIRLLRRRPRDLLEPSPSGPIAVLGERYAPRRIAVRRHRSTLDTPANRRCVWVLAQLQGLAREVVSALSAAGPEHDRVVRWVRAIDESLLTSALSHLYPAAAQRSTPSVPTTEELTDERYRLIREVSDALSAANAWTLGRHRRASYSYVAYADRIYQAFVAHVLAGERPSRDPMGFATSWPPTTCRAIGST